MNSTHAWYHSAVGADVLPHLAYAAGVAHRDDLVREAARRRLSQRGRRAGRRRRDRASGPTGVRLGLAGARGGRIAGRLTLRWTGRP